ncbi:MAG: hypothetical protein KJP00_01775, partial [Bacteroidia bacterium]|nr:hypothetical protein [Bacteroidia bacterium]
MRLSLMFGFLLVFGLVQGQKSEVLHQFFEFRDGIYLSHEALLENTPMIHFENEVKDLYINNSKILRVNPKNFGLSDSSTIHYIVFEGLPHLRVTRCCPDQVVYAGLTVVGALSLAVYESEVIVDIP